MSGHPDDGHRQGYRFRTDVQAELQHQGQLIPCEVQNVSRSGVLLAGDLPAEMSQIVDFSLRAPTGSLTLRLRGRIIRRQPAPDGSGVNLALEFVDMDDTRRDALEVFLARLLQAPAATDSLESLKPGASLVEIKHALESIPLPQRISMASRTGLKEREILRHDTNAAVLEALVHNPGFTVTEARALAGSAYLIPGTLDALANNMRFRDDEELRMAIATHPRVSIATAEKVTVGFNVPQLKKLLAKPGLNQLLREKLHRKSTKR